MALQPRYIAALIKGNRVASLGFMDFPIYIARLIKQEGSIRTAMWTSAYSRAYQRKVPMMTATDLCIINHPAFGHLFSSSAQRVAKP